MTAPFRTNADPALWPDRRLIYIAGYGRSGSTVLDIALSCHPRIEGLGELGAVFGAVAGRPIDDRSPVERRVAAAARPAASGPTSPPAGGSAAADRRRLLAADRLVRHLERLLPGPWPGAHRRARYRDLQARLLHELHDQTGAPVLVDSSKTSWLRTWRLPLLAPIVPRIDCVVVVRDLADVVASVRRGHGETLEHQRLPTLRAVLGWAVATTSAVVIGRRVCGPDRTRLVRHDQLVADPGGQLTAIFDWLDLDPAGDAVAAGLTAGFEPRNQLVGNRVRSAGRVHIQRTAGGGAPLPRPARLAVRLVATLVDRVALRRIEPVEPMPFSGRRAVGAGSDQPDGTTAEWRSA